MSASPEEPSITDTRAWVERVVIGLKLCPFAPAPALKGAIRYAMSEAETAEALLEDLAAELQCLVDAPPEQIETTMLIHPRVLQDFHDFNDFLEFADEALQTMGLEGEIQIASFHPQYQFAGTGFDDIGNETNRSPYPTLHLLREESVARAVDAFGNTGSISVANLATLEKLGPEGLAAVKQGGPG
jgi:hypothetical protein